MKMYVCMQLSCKWAIIHVTNWNHLFIYFLQKKQMKPMLQGTYYAPFYKM